MPVEIEAKLQVDSHEPVRRALVAAGAQYCGRVLEINHLLDCEDHSLRDSGRGLRVRRVTVEDGAGPGATVTYKGPKQPGAFKARDEHESEIADPDALMAILRALGFSRVLTFEKRRETWRLGPCTVELDELPMLGRFVEIEGPDRAEIARVIEQTGLDAHRSIADAYAGLLAALVDPKSDPKTLEFRF